MPLRPRFHDVSPALLALILASATLPATVFAGSEQPGRIPAIKLYDTPDHRVAFVKGTVATLRKMPAREFWLSDSVEAWEQDVHPAPRRQYVVTLQGELEFQVSDGSTFRLAPGTVLLAEDTGGAGHRWKMLPGSGPWVRMYLPMAGEDDGFEPSR
ncbi:hypothetical protein C7Y68_02220 [Paracidovorax avenae]|uniref:hypothetical protein n=1 Tax=Paracidovorax avenae TaxID=80867 RepID=UPI000D17C533|nr:hypothetical protein [Paracidovorax avenae]AVS97756.1 hypothetical protein C8236_02200 [Paracidovorax avenae]AVT04797.1 hypothetical protein C8248_01480 [Paracidovorax avenae]AVT18947.1 hypothetical protein C7Y68_02220 [Paracidovorax avenae]